MKSDFVQAAIGGLAQVCASSFSPVHFQFWTWPAGAFCHSHVAAVPAPPRAPAQFSGTQPAAVWGLWSKTKKQEQSGTLVDEHRKKQSGYQIRKLSHKVTNTTELCDKTFALVKKIWTRRVTQMDISGVLRFKPEAARCLCRLSRQIRFWLRWGVCVCMHVYVCARAFV